MNLERTFSKDLAGDLRKETADKIKEARNQPDSFAKLNSVKEFPDDYERFGDLKEKIEIAKKDIFGKIFKTEKYKELVNEVEELLKIKKESDINKVQREYQKEFDNILSQCPLSEIEREKYLSTEVMEEMPLEDYLVLLKRLSGEAFYHVTRYGVRENTFESTGGGHSAGEGSFVNSFTPLLEDGHINSATSTMINTPDRLSSSLKSEVIEKLKSEGKTTDEIVSLIMSEFDTGYFLDRESTHFSYGKDLHNMYGGEDNYKFYFYYPVEYILQNDFFHKTREAIDIGKGNYNNRGGIEQSYNDFEIFNFGEGVSTKAGILCITGDIEVDPETGSQYLLNNGKPEIDEGGKFKKPKNTISSKDYWEGYFTKHPEIKPNKIIYSNFATSTYDYNPDLEKLAKDKWIYNQSEEKMKEFKEYEASTRGIIRGMIQKLVKE
jgi:hypothetical protein